MTVSEKKELMRYLKRGDKKLICKMAGVHETVMYAWISDRLKTSSIEPFVIEISSQRKKEFEQQTNTADPDKPADHFDLTLQNIQLKGELNSTYLQLSTFQKLVSAKNRVYNQLFLKLIALIKKSDLNPLQKNIILDSIQQFQSDFSFVGRYKGYADILSTINPLLSKSLEVVHADLTDHEKQLLALVKLNLSDREIAIILAVSDKMVLTNMELLKYKLKLKPGSELTDFVNSL